MASHAAAGGGGDLRLARAHVAILATLLALAALSWIVTRNRMLGMDAGPGTDPGALGFYVISWVVMMAAMMFPSVWPMVLTFAFVQRRRRERAAAPGDADGSGRAGAAVAAPAGAVSTSIFLAGYLITWTAFGLGAYALYEGARSLHIHALRWHELGRPLAAATLAAAAIYQLTPLKDACLRRCRGTLDFIMTEWREGVAGALKMGAIHGSWCVGCCWGLMVSLFALGVMSVPWMVAIGALIAIEKLLPSKRLANRSVALVLLALAAGIAIAPSAVPGLTQPGSAQAARAMRAMGTGAPARPARPTTAPTAPSPGSTSSVPMTSMPRR